MLKAKNAYFGGQKKIDILRKTGTHQSRFHVLVAWFVPFIINIIIIIIIIIIITSETGKSNLQLFYTI